MAGSRVHMMGFDEGKGISVEQKFALGQIGQDRIGNRWSYVQFTDAVEVGEWVADSTISGAVLVVTEASPNELIVATSRFTTGEVYRGAVGLIVSGTGAGQAFVITGQYTQGTNTHSTIQ